MKNTALLVLVALILCSFSPVSPLSESPSYPFVVGQEPEVAGDPGIPDDWINSATRYTDWDWVPPISDVSSTDIKFTSTGMRTFIVSNHLMAVYGFELTEAFNPNSAAGSPSEIKYTSAEAADPNAIDFNQDCTSYFITDNQATLGVYKYNMSTPCDISTGVYDASDSILLSSSDGITQIRDIEFVNNGNEMHLLNFNPASIYVYDLSEPYNPSTAIKNSAKTENFSDVQTIARGFNYHLNGSEILIVNKHIDACALSAPYNPSSRTSCREIPLPFNTGADASYGVWVNDEIGTAYFANLGTIFVMKYQ